MEEKKGFPKHYQEQYKGRVNELNQSGWGEKFIKAKNEGITPELIFEYQRDYARELLDDNNLTKGGNILEHLKYISYMMETYATEEDARKMIKDGITTPGMWAYLTAYYYEG